MAIDFNLVIAASISLVVGLVFVAFAVLERGYKRFLEEKKLDPKLKFDGAYMLNFWVSASLGSVIVITVIPSLIAAIGNPSAEMTLAGLILNAVLGYSITFSALEHLNTSTERKMEAAEAVEAAETAEKNQPS